MSSSLSDMVNSPKLPIEYRLQPMDKTPLYWFVVKQANNPPKATPALRASLVALRAGAPCCSQRKQSIYPSCRFMMGKQQLMPSSISKQHVYDHNPAAATGKQPPPVLDTLHKKNSL
jgi:hypothetical protein